MTTDQIIASIVAYGLKEGLMGPEDETYAINKLLHLFRLSEYHAQAPLNVEPALEQAIRLGQEEKIEEIENLNEADAFEAEIMDQVLMRPSQVIKAFWDKYASSPAMATDWLYNFAIKSRYVRKDRLEKNIGYPFKGERCSLEITINLSKPEKDPKDIIKAKQMKSSSYPQCALCAENEGFYGSFSQAGRSNIRLIPLRLNGEDFFFQYSPYGYFNEHCIVLKKEHVPMEINPDTFKRLFAFVDMFPSYFLGSNADLPIVGGSILSHEHYQGGKYVFPLDKAPLKETFSYSAFPGVKAAIVDWPLSVIKASSSSREQLLSFGCHVLEAWRAYDDSENGIYSEENGEKHNTLNPILRKNGDEYQLLLALRNNRTSPEYPLGIFHPHPELFHIKKENIGLIEVMGLAILPGRLKDELKACSAYLLNPLLTPDPSIEKHLDWLKMLQSKYPHVAQEDAEKILYKEVGLVFEQVLADAGVFKKTQLGQEGFRRFMRSL